MTTSFNQKKEFSSHINGAEFNTMSVAFLEDLEKMKTEKNKVNKNTNRNTSSKQENK